MVKLGSKVSTLAGFMSPANLAGQQRRIVLQALIEVAPQQADAILHEALAQAELPDVPAELARLSVFIFGPLQSAIESALGADVARRAVDQLQAVVDASIEESAEAEESAVAPTQALVLVVDPDVTTRSQVVLFLKKNGQAAVSAPDDNIALAMCVRYRPSVVVAGQDAARGQQLAALLRVAFGDDAPPLVLMGSGEASGSVKAIVPKPVTEDALMSAIRPFL